MITNFSYDWIANWTIAESEIELSNFSFQGIGWYQYSGDTLLVTATENPDRFLFTIWNERDPRPAMLDCLNLPQHTSTQ
jgi:hypothetical protein